MTQSPPPSSDATGGVGVGTLLADRYRVGGLLATGGMGAIWRGHDSLLERPVAIKTLHPHLANTPFAGRFVQEGQTVAALTHPNLVGIYDMGDAGGLPYLVMEYVQGEHLLALLERDGPQSPASGIPLTLQICRGLAYAHERGVIHRDIKPQNILISAAGQIKIVDFGIARGPEAAEMTAPGWVLGTAHYLAPEVVAGEPATARSDLYSLGVVLYRLFTGRLPFEGDNPLAVAMLHRTTPPPPPSSVRPGLPSALEAVLLRLLEKDPERRYPSAAAIAADLAHLDQQPPPLAASAAQEEATTVLPAGNRAGGAGVTAKSGRPRPRRFPARTWGLASLLAGALLIGALFWLWPAVAGSGEPPPPSSPAATATVPAAAAPPATPSPSPPAAPPPVPSPTLAPRPATLPELLAALRSEANGVTGGDRGGAGERLRDRVDDLARTVTEAKLKDFSKKLGELRKEIADQVRRGALAPAAAGRMEALLQSLTSAVPSGNTLRSRDDD